LVRQALAATNSASHYVSADDTLLPDSTWLIQQWKIARDLPHSSGRVLAIDEVQHIANWPVTVKALWDEDTRNGLNLQLILTGSAPLVLGHGLTESLAGRFERLAVPHWSLAETQAAFGYSLEEFIAYGGYPAGADLIADPLRWTQYVRDALIEATVSRDVLQLERVDRPALLRRLFDLSCAYAGQELSYTKMLGQLQDSGNTTTLAWYLELLHAAGMACGLQKFAGQQVRQRASSPKLAVFAPGLRTAVLGQNLDRLRADPEQWGRQVEVAVGAHLLNGAVGHSIDVLWWRERDLEVDYVLRRGADLVAVEVKSGARRRALPGMASFLRGYPQARPLLVGAGGLDIGEFLGRSTSAWMDWALG